MPEEAPVIVRPRGLRPPRLYGLPKISTESVRLTAIVSTKIALSYELVKRLACQRSLNWTSRSAIWGSLSTSSAPLTPRLSPGYILVTYDVVSLFTKVPLQDDLRLLIWYFHEESEKSLATFWHHNSCFNSQYYEGSYGLNMGLPPAPVITNFYAETF